MPGQGANFECGGQGRPLGGSVEEMKAKACRDLGRTEGTSWCKGPVVGVCLAGVRNVKGSTVAAVEWTSRKAVGGEVIEASGSQRRFEPRHEVADCHADSTSWQQPEREVSGVRQGGEEAEAGDECGMDQGGSWEQRQAA